MKEKKYVIRDMISNERYMESFAFTANGIHIEFTSDPAKAAKVSIREFAEHIAKCSPSGKVAVAK